MGREEELVQSFETHFSSYKNKKIVLYGLGIDTQIILRHFPDYPIVGLLDRYQSAGTIYQKPIFAYRDLTQKQIDVLIIACEKQEIEYTRKKVSNLCFENRICVFDSDGNPLDISDGNVRPPHHPSWDMSKDNLTKQLCNYDMVLVEMENTLYIMPNEAEDNSAPFIVERDDMGELIKRASLRAKVALVDNAVGLQKKRAMREEAKSKYGIDIVDSEAIPQFAAGASKVLYIGCVDQAHKQQLADLKIDVYMIYLPQELLVNSAYRAAALMQTEQRTPLPLKLFETKAFSSPFSLAGSMGKKQIRTPEEIGYLFLAPLITDFVEWLLARIQAQGVDCMIFSARDGFLVEKMFQMMEGNHKIADTQYLLTSRLVCNMVSLKAEEDIIKATRINFFGTPVEMLENRFQLKQNRIKEYPEKMPIEEYVLWHKDAILEEAKRVRDAYVKYLESFEFQKYKKIGFFDLVASGTCQQVVSELLDRDMKGFYLTRLDSGDTKKQALDIEAYTPYNDNLIDHSLFMECIMTSDMPPVRSFSNGPCFERELRTPEQIRFVMEVQQGMKNYLADYLCCHSSHVACEDNRALVIKLFGLVSKRYSNNLCETFNHYVLVDEVFQMKNDLENICYV